MLRPILFLSLLVFLFGCKSTGGDAQSLSVESTAELVVLQINDVYEIGALEGGKVGGLARVATLRKELTAKHDNVVTVLSGDFLNPSAIGLAKVNGRRLRGAQCSHRPGCHSAQGVFYSTPSVRQRGSYGHRLP